ncbi:MAG: metallophosphoesterase [bacterium]
MKLLLTADLHCDESKLQFILSSDVDAVLVAGDLIDLFSSRFYRFQKSRVRRWYQELLVREKQLVWSSGNHDFHDDEMTPILIASPEWMTKCGNISDGQTGVHEKNGLRVAITTVPWPVTEGYVLSNGIKMSYHAFVEGLLLEGKKLQGDGIPWMVLAHDAQKK